MDLPRFLLGLALAALAFTPVVVAACSWRRRLLSEWSGPPAVLVDVVLALSAVVLTAELLGMAGFLRLAPLTVALALIGGVGWLLAARWRRSSGVAAPHMSREEIAPSETPRSSNRPSMLMVALVLTSVVVADWSSRTVDAFHHGMTTPDTIWYHMPFAARFVQTGSITAVHFVDFHSSIAFYPENGELIHSVGILFMGTDFLSPVLNMGWLALLLLASWCVGRPFGVAPVALAGGAVLMCTPGLVATQPGGAYTDIVGLGLLAVALALLSNWSMSDPRGPRAGTRLPAMCAAALATGLALGTKFTFVVPAAALTVGIWAITPRGQRVRRGGLWLLLVLATGGFWYVRNLVVIGNPLPNAIHLGPFHLPGPPGLSPASSVASFLFSGSDWRRFFLPGFRESLGPAWWAVLGLALAGLVLGVVGPRNGIHRMLALVGVVTGIGFVFTPQPLTVPVLYPDVPYNFVYNLRYSFAALLAGLLLLPIARAANSTRWQWGLLGASGLTVLVAQLDSTIWPSSVFTQQFAPAVGGIDAGLGVLIGAVTLAAGWFLIRHRPARPSRPVPPPVMLVAGVVGVVGVVGAFGLQQLYQHDRYRNTPPLAPLYAWAQHVRNARLAITGQFSNDTYPLDGPDASNYVQLVGESQPRGGFAPIAGCSEFRRVVDAGRYTDVITIVAGDPRDPHADGSQEARWVGRDPAATLVDRWTIHHYVFNELVVSVFRLDGRLDPGSCPSGE